MIIDFIEYLVIDENTFESEEEIPDSITLHDMMIKVSDIVDERKPATQPFQWVPTNSRKLECLLGLKDDSIKIGRVKNKDNVV